MDIQELTRLLNEVANKDLADGADIYDHPCTVAVRAITQSFNDVNCLKEIVKKNVSKGKYSKRVAMLVGLSYDPEF